MVVQLRSTRLLVPAFVVLAAGGAAGFLARSESSPADHATTAEAEAVVPAVAALSTDGRYSPFEAGDPMPFEPQAREPVPAPVPQPNAQEWSRLSNLTVQAVQLASTPRETELEMPAPAGFDESLTPVERSRLVAARSVESEPSRQGSGPGMRIAFGTGVCIPGIDE